MLGILIWLLAWGIGLAIFGGHREPEKGSTKPLPVSWFGVVGSLVIGFWSSRRRTIRGDAKPLSEESLLQKFALIVGRRVELEARMLFVASALYGMAAFIDVGDPGMEAWASGTRHRRHRCRRIQWNAHDDWQGIDP